MFVAGRMYGLRRRVEKSSLGTISNWCMAIAAGGRSLRDTRAGGVAGFRVVSGNEANNVSQQDVR